MKSIVSRATTRPGLLMSKPPAGTRSDTPRAGPMRSLSKHPRGARAACRHPPRAHYRWAAPQSVTLNRSPTATWPGVKTANLAPRITPSPVARR